MFRDRDYGVSGIGRSSREALSSRISVMYQALQSITGEHSAPWSPYKEEGNAGAFFDGPKRWGGGGVRLEGRV